MSCMGVTLYRTKSCTLDIEELLPKAAKEQRVTIRDDRFKDSMKTCYFHSEMDGKIFFRELGRSNKEMRKLCEAVTKNPYDSVSERVW